MITWSQFFELVVILCVLAGTYLITKVSFVDFIMRGLNNSKEFSDLPPFLRRIGGLYHINNKNWKDHLAGQKKAITAYEPFAGFVWIAFASLLQVIKILFFR